jgi:hypothetical protein
MELIKKCPKCGSDDIWKAEDGWTDMISAFIECNDCEFYIRPSDIPDGEKDDYQGLVKVWNNLHRDKKQD